MLKMQQGTVHKDIQSDISLVAAENIQCKMWDYLEISC